MVDVSGPSIRETLDSLNEEAKRRIMYASNYEIPHFEILPGKTFIGVHLSDSDRRVKVSKRAGHWAVGEIM